MKSKKPIACERYFSDQVPVTTNSLPRFYYFPGSNQWRVSPLQWLKLRKLELGRHPHTLFWEDCLVAAAVWRLSGIPTLPGIMLPVPVQSRNEQSIEQLLPCQKNTSTCASSMSCQSCQLMWRSRCNPVHIDHQYWRKGRHAGVSQWPLWENHSLPSFHFRKGSADQWTVSTFAMLNSEKAWAWQTPQTLCLEELVADAAVWQASRNPIATSPTSDQESRCLFQFGARMSRGSNNLCHAGRANICPRL